MNPNELKRTTEWNCQDIVFCANVSDTFERGWIGSSDSGVYEVKLDDPKTERTPLTGDGHSSYVTGIARHETTLVSGSYDKHLVWWDTEERKAVRKVVGHDKWIRAVVITPNGKQVVSVADDMRAVVWDLASGNKVAELRDHAEITPHNYPSMLYAVAASPDGSLIATGDRIGHIAIWNAETHQKVGELEAPGMYTWDPKARRHATGGIRSLAFSPDAKQLAVGGIGHIGNIDHLDGPSRLEVFDIASGDRVHEIEDKKKKGLLEQLIWHPSGDWILAVGGANNGFINVYETSEGKLIQQSDNNAHIHAVCHDTELANLFVVGHNRLSRWTIS